MTLTELRYVVAVARERHFGRAAEACFVSQPTLSVGVRKLEDELGMLLFERGTNEISVTPGGERVVAQAQRVLEEAAALRRLAGEGGDELSGPLRLGAIYTVGPYLLPHLIPVLRERAPRMPLVIEEGYTASLVRRLRNGELDIIVIALPFEGPSLQTCPLYAEPFVALLPASHPLIEREQLRSSDLDGEHVLLLGEGHCFRAQVLEACPECNSTDADQAQLESSSLETIRLMVASGIGVTVLPSTAAGADRYSQRLLAIRRFVAPAPGRTVGLAWRRSFTRPLAVETVRQAVLACNLSGVRMLECSPGTAPDA